MLSFVSGWETAMDLLVVFVTSAGTYTPLKLQLVLFTSAGTYTSLTPQLVLTRSNMKHPLLQTQPNYLAFRVEPNIQS